MVRTASLLCVGMSTDRPQVTVPALAEMKRAGARISMITAYDATFARLVDLAGIDMILVGDSLGMVVQGESNTIPVDLDEMIQAHLPTIQSPA